MDRISALRNVEDALAAFEGGEIELATLEERVTGVLRTYATDLDAGALDADGSVFRVPVPDRERPLVVVASDAGEARERAATMAGLDPDGLDPDPV